MLFQLPQLVLLHLFLFLSIFDLLQLYKTCSFLHLFLLETEFRKFRKLEKLKESILQYITLPYEIIQECDHNGKIILENLNPLIITENRFKKKKWIYDIKDLIQQYGKLIIILNDKRIHSISLESLEQ